MPWYISIYVALLLISLPSGVLVLRRLERDWLHPVASTVSSLLSILFTLAWWLPELIQLRGWSPWLAFAFVLAWDAYMVLRLKYRFPELLASMQIEQDANQTDQVLLIGLVLMLPAYVFGALVCLQASG
jgi:hypothetical protein